MAFYKDSQFGSSDWDKSISDIYQRTKTSLNAVNRRYGTPSNPGLTKTPTMNSTRFASGRETLGANLSGVRESMFASTNVPQPPSFHSSSIDLGVSSMPSAKSAATSDASYRTIQALMERIDRLENKCMSLEEKQSDLQSRQHDSLQQAAKLQSVEQQSRQYEEKFDKLHNYYGFLEVQFLEMKKQLEKQRQNMLSESSQSFSGMASKGLQFDVIESIQSDVSKSRASMLKIEHAYQDMETWREVVDKQIQKLQRSVVEVTVEVNETAASYRTLMSTGPSAPLTQSSQCIADLFEQSDSLQKKLKQQQLQLIELQQKEFESGSQQQFELEQYEVSIQHQISSSAMKLQQQFSIQLESLHNQIAQLQLSGQSPAVIESFATAAPPAMSEALSSGVSQAIQERIENNIKSLFETRMADLENQLRYGVESMEVDEKLGQSNLALSQLKQDLRQELKETLSKVYKLENAFKDVQRDFTTFSSQLNHHTHQLANDWSNQLAAQLTTQYQQLTSNQQTQLQQQEQRLQSQLESLESHYHNIVFDLSQQKIGVMNVESRQTSCLSDVQVLTKRTNNMEMMLGQTKGVLQSSIDKMQELVTQRVENDLKALQRSIETIQSDLTKLPNQFVKTEELDRKHLQLKKKAELLEGEVKGTEQRFEGKLSNLQTEFRQSAEIHISQSKHQNQLLTNLSSQLDANNTKLRKLEQNIADVKVVAEQSSSQSQSTYQMFTAANNTLQSQLQSLNISQGQNWGEFEASLQSKIAEFKDSISESMQQLEGRLSAQYDLGEVEYKLSRSSVDIKTIGDSVKRLEESAAQQKGVAMAEDELSRRLQKYYKEFYDALDELRQSVTTAAVPTPAAISSPSSATHEAVPESLNCSRQSDDSNTVVSDESFNVDSSDELDGADSGFNVATNADMQATQRLPPSFGPIMDGHDSGVEEESPARESHSQRESLDASESESSRSVSPREVDSEEELDANEFDSFDGPVRAPVTALDNSFDDEYNENPMSATKAFYSDSADSDSDDRREGLDESFSEPLSPHTPVQPEEREATGTVLWNAQETSTDDIQEVDSSSSVAERFSPVEDQLMNEQPLDELVDSHPLEEADRDEAEEEYDGGIDGGYEMTRKLSVYDSGSESTRSRRDSSDTSSQDSYSVEDEYKDPPRGSSDSMEELTDDSEVPTEAATTPVPDSHSHYFGSFVSTDKTASLERSHDGEESGEQPWTEEKDRAASNSFDDEDEEVSPVHLSPPQQRHGEEKAASEGIDDGYEMTRKLSVYESDSESSFSSASRSGGSEPSSDDDSMSYEEDPLQEGGGNVASHPTKVAIHSLIEPHPSKIADYESSESDISSAASSDSTSVNDSYDEISREGSPVVPEEIDEGEAPVSIPAVPAVEMDTHERYVAVVAELEGRHQLQDEQREAFNSFDEEDVEDSQDYSQERSMDQIEALPVHDDHLNSSSELGNDIQSFLPSKEELGSDDESDLSYGDLPGGQEKEERKGPSQGPVYESDDEEVMGEEATEPIEESDLSYGDIYGSSEEEQYHDKSSTVTAMANPIFSGAPRHQFDSHEDDEVSVEELVAEEVSSPAVAYPSSYDHPIEAEERYVASDSHDDSSFLESEPVTPAKQPIHDAVSDIPLSVQLHNSFDDSDSDLSPMKPNAAAAAVAVAEVVPLPSPPKISATLTVKERLRLRQEAMKQAKLSSAAGSSEQQHEMAQSQTLPDILPIVPKVETADKISLSTSSFDDASSTHSSASSSPEKQPSPNRLAPIPHRPNLPSLSKIGSDKSGSPLNPLSKQSIPKLNMSSLSASNDFMSFSPPTSQKLGQSKEAYSRHSPQSSESESPEASPIRSMATNDEVMAFDDFDDEFD